MKTTNRRNIYLLAFSLIVVMLGFGMVIPVLPFYIQQFGAGGSAYGLLVATAALTEFLFGPLWGSLSDRTGRKPIIMVGMFGYGLSMLFFGLSTQLWMLFAARALSGVLSAALLSTAMAYIGDSTSEKERGGGMGILGASAGVGTIIGPGIGGLLANGSLATPFFISAAVCFLAVGMIAMMLPESLPQEGRGMSQGRIKFVDFSGLWRALFSPIGFLLCLAFLVTFGTSNFESIFSLYVLKKLNYSTEQIGVILTGMGFVALIGRGLLTGPVTKKWGEVRVIKGSILAAALGFVFLLQVYDFFTVVAATGFFVFAVAFLRPSIHSLTSQRATLGQGASLGLSNAFVSLGRIAGALWAGAVFDLGMDYPFYSGIVILLAALFLALIFISRETRPTAAPKPVEP
jgi:DHA1 family multidrug resistance protein-like MFS transporter